MTAHPMIDKEATEEFNALISAPLNQWQKGEIPFEDALERMRTLKQSAVRAGHVANEARAEFLMGVLQGYRTNLTLGQQHFERARELYGHVGNEGRLITCDLNLGEIHRQKGDFARAQRLFDQAYETARTVDNFRAQTIAMANKGQALLSMGRIDDARQAIEHAFNLYQTWNPEQPLNELLVEMNFALASIYLYEERHADAWASAKNCYQIALEVGKPMQIGFAHRTMAEVLTTLGATPEADREDFPLDIDSYFHEAMQAFMSVNAEGEAARTTLAQAKSLAARGRRVQAARRLQEAMLAFAKLGMVDDATKAADLQTVIF